MLEAPTTNAVPPSFAWDMELHGTNEQKMLACLLRIEQSLSRMEDLLVYGLMSEFVDESCNALKPAYLDEPKVDPLSDPNSYKGNKDYEPRDKNKNRKLK
jgi:hypothetical protein